MAPAAESECPKCGGSGWVIQERDGISGASRCDCRDAERARQSERNARIPPLYQNASLDNFLVPSDNPVARTGLGTALLTVRAFVREFPTGDKPGLLFIGDTGTGKTHLAVAALRALIAKGHEGVFFDYQTLLDRIRASFDKVSGASDREAYSTALEAPILLLDDLGAHRATDFTEDTVTAILTHRCNYKKPLIATTNLPDQDVTGKAIEYITPGGTAVGKKTLSEVIGMRARSRLFEMCKVIRMPAVEDYRIRKSR
jgi:DNA replication protein DnaC